MVGKIKRVRQKLHHEAVKLTQETGERSWNSGRKSVKLTEPGGLLILKQSIVNTLKHVDTEEKVKTLSGEDPVKHWNVQSSSIFAETKISPEALVQSLDADAAQSPDPIQKGDEDATGASSASPAPERRRKPKFRASKNDVLVTEVKGIYLEMPVNFVLPEKPFGRRSLPRSVDWGCRSDGLIFVPMSGRRQTPFTMTPRLQMDLHCQIH
ncbi:uncharacterized protein LOC121322889 isoform X3 [Polyodon spathula]|uniref:uncharacterized protein LOC121322889 isoform X3 n=1 Tax=Polyodon spathula TaxID=7913 RepID=UPI001B7EED41|nr:uncharacterized protein LOC121322889 isoform X3 [Polyodon spathula]